MRVGVRAMVPALVVALLASITSTTGAQAPGGPPTYDQDLFHPIAAATPNATPWVTWTTPPLGTVAPTEPPRATPTARGPEHPTTRPMAQPRPTTRPAARGGIVGTATYYCNRTHPELHASRCMARFPDVGGDQMLAAAGPELRVALGGNAGSSCPCPWRGRRVTVTAASGAAVTVTLADWCACGGDHVIDLYGDPFAILNKAGTVAPVRVTWGK